MAGCQPCRSSGYIYLAHSPEQQLVGHQRRHPDEAETSGDAVDVTPFDRQGQVVFTLSNFANDLNGAQTRSGTPLIGR